MEFKRCSVDGHIFGMPIAKAAPTQDAERSESVLSDTVHPLRNLLAGSNNGESEANAGESGESHLKEMGKRLTFNAEMFLRVMSICHTVVVEKEHKAPDTVGENSTAVKKSKFFKSKKSNTSSTVSNGAASSQHNTTHNTQSKMDASVRARKKDGAPEGSNYQAESPDEGALVSAASNEYGFQFIGRDSSGVKISCPCPSLFEDASIVQGVKDGTITAKSLAAQTVDGHSKYSDPEPNTSYEISASRVETWSILAINKFDSDRKRMSVLVRSPPELGSIPLLLCKGADSSMLLNGVCEGLDLVEQVDNSNLSDDSEVKSLLGLQSHLGEFASEGLRTLVLGVKILSDEETEAWLSKFKDASTSIENRDKKLTAVAYEIEKNLHIVGATAIEDRLQDGVPETIANLGKAGIKLWVLTGDKRETAIEIGYSTKVLSPKMHLTEIVDGPAQKVKTLLAMELIRHIKIGNLPDYQLASLDEGKRFSLKSLMNCLSELYHSWKKIWFAWRHFYISHVKQLWTSKEVVQEYLDELVILKEAEARRVDPRVQRRKVRECALAIIKEFWNDPSNAQLKEKYVRDHGSHDESSVIDADEPPAVFERAKSARASLKNIRQHNGHQDHVRELALATVTEDNDILFDEAALSMQSFRDNNTTSNFDKRKRTVMERLFAVDSDVRKGKLEKHVKDEYRDTLALESKEHADDGHQAPFDVSAVKRGLVVEGAALKHLLGDHLLEEMLFAVASCSNSVIACRVSPIQKALLLKMVRKYVSPTPTTLAIGDGANDVGMIQEAHIGIGISGLEGQQAVNSSDFAIAQFRYLESLLLVHGRWNFMRMSKTILFFFYKNATMIGLMMVFSGKDDNQCLSFNLQPILTCDYLRLLSNMIERCLHSGTPIFDPWVIAVFNFVGGSLPIIFMAVFDRDLPRSYVTSHPEVYKSGPSNEFLSFRMVLRWVFITIIQTFAIYYFTAPALSLGGGVTSAFKGLMGNWGRDIPGDGEGGDLQIFGTTVYSNLIYVVTLKVSLCTA
jgi:magnesium-transporting ATPase (P-type)